jgi:hypothetical protein
LNQPVHQRLYSQVLTKDEVAKKEQMDVIEEEARKKEFLQKTFEDHRISVS